VSEERCLGPEELGDHESWRADDPRRLHASECARCQALLTSYRLFTAAPDDLPPERLAEARIRLAQARAAWPAGHEERPARPLGPQREVGTALDRLLRWFAVPRYRAALAFAALLAVAGVGYWNSERGVDGRQPRVLRAQNETPGAGPVAAVTLLAPQRVDGRLVLRWHAVPGADAYEVALFDAGFSVLSHQATGRDTMLELAAPPGAGADAAAPPLYWQVTARYSGDVLARSVPAPLRGSRGR
jgi:hypothetical protein